MALFGHSEPAPDARDALIAELRADKARLIEENSRLQQTLVAMADAKAYYMLNPRAAIARDAAIAKGISTGTEPHTTAPPARSSFPTNNPSDYRNKVWEPPQSMKEIEKIFKERARAEIEGLLAGSGDPVRPEL